MLCFAVIYSTVAHRLIIIYAKNRITIILRKMYQIKLLSSFIYEMKLVLIVQKKRRGKPSLTPNQTEHFIDKILEMRVHFQIKFVENHTLTDYIR